MPEINDCGGDAAAYALGALEPAQAEAFRRHLEQCAVCRDELEVFEGVVRALPMAAPQHPLPKGLRRRVMRAVRDEPHPAGSQRPRRRAVPGRVARGRGVAPLPAAAVIAGGVVAGVELSSTPSSGRVIHAQVTAVSGTAELRVAGGRGELVVRRLSPPPPGHVYEVWLQSGAAPPIPASVLFSVSAGGNAEVGLPDSLVGVSQVMVTREPHGGSPAPTSAPVIVANLT
jgi:anti-sigma factor RsiW